MSLRPDAGDAVAEAVDIVAGADDGDERVVRVEGKVLFGRRRRAFEPL